jgi:hypothetical protein
VRTKLITAITVPVLAAVAGIVPMLINLLPWLSRFRTLSGPRMVFHCGTALAFTSLQMCEFRFERRATVAETKRGVSKIKGIFS